MRRGPAATAVLRHRRDGCGPPDPAGRDAKARCQRTRRPPEGLCKKTLRLLLSSPTAPGIRLELQATVKRVIDVTPGDQLTVPLQVGSNRSQVVTLRSNDEPRVHDHTRSGACAFCAVQTGGATPAACERRIPPAPISGDHRHCRCSPDGIRGASGGRYLTSVLRR